MTIKFDIPFNGDFELVDFIKEHSPVVEMVYGRAEDGYPQGRNTTNRPPITLEGITKATESLNKKGIKFNYLINGNDHGNKEFNSTYRKKFITFVKDLKQRGVEIVTIGNLFLLEVVSQKVSDISLGASIIVEPDNLTRIKQIAKAGAKYITLSKTLLKNFSGLTEISKNMPSGAIPILLANDPCLHHCAYTDYHNNILSHFTSEGTEYVNYCRLHCTQDFAEDPRKVISASFIRPEDIKGYNEMGFELFKLCDRKQTTSWLKNVINAYLNGTYEGNLSDLMAPWSNIGGKYPYPHKITQEEIKEKGFQGIRGLVRFTPNIDNKSMDNYLDYWKEVKTSGCANEDCDKCNYCATVAEKAYKPNILRNKRVGKNIERVLEFSREVSR